MRVSDVYPGRVVSGVDLAALRMIPGSDPGACPDCGGWRRAGMNHDCEAEREHRRKQAEEIAALAPFCQEQP